MRGVAAIAVVVACAATLSATALAAEVTREEYKAAAEPICEANTQANARIFAGVRKQVREDKLKPAAAKFEKAARALTRARNQLLALNQPSADRTRLKNWFAEMKKEIELFKQTARYLRAGEKAKALRMTEELTRTGNRANVQVLGFEFEHCVFNPAKFL